jgi:hypothetical protein
MWLRCERRGRWEVNDIQCVGLRCGPWELVQRWGGGIHMNKGRVGEDRGSKETDGCPLTLAYDQSIKLNMQSANGKVDQSLGLARNVPCKINSITLYLQIHII